MAAQDVQTNFEMSLRDQLMAAQQHSDPDPPSSQSASGPAPYPSDHGPRQGSHGQIDPSIGGRPPSPGADGNYMVLDDNDMNMPMSRNSKRELSTTKRAAQNRAAQRAFRQRKEAYITKLEKQVKDYGAMEEDFKALTHENYQLREYILSLQSRIIATSADLPPPPANVNLQGMPNPAPGQQAQHTSHNDARAAAYHNQQAQDERQVQQEGRDVPPGSAEARAPTASMAAPASGATPETDSLPAAAVRQLRAAAAEAGELGGAGAGGAS